MKVTIFNKVVDKTTKQNVLKRTVLNHERIRWENEEVISLQGQGVNKQDTTVVFIPFSFEQANDYLPPTEYKRDPIGHWTLQNGDILVKGEVLENITQTELTKNYDDVKVITSVSDNRFAHLSILKHFEVVAR